jgi:hypothetical protein
MKMLAVGVADIAVEGEFQFERRRFGTTPEPLRLLTEWLIEQEVGEAVSNRGRRGENLWC